jgi:hypothetical protein
MSRNVSFLSVPDDGGKTDLWSADDGSGRQRWLVRPGPGGQSYNILIAGGVNNDRKFLSTTSDGSKVDLFSQDDGSGRQRWIIEKLVGGLVHIPILGGVQNDRRFLSVTSDGTKVDLFSTDDGSGRQRWKISGSIPNAPSAGAPAAQPTTSTPGYPLPPPGIPDGLNGRQITLDLNGDWEGYYMSPGLVTDIRIHHTGGHLTAEVLNNELKPTGQQFFRGDLGEKRGFAQIGVSNAGSWNRETLNVVDLDHVQVGSRPPFQRITMPRRNDMPCSSKNDAGVGAPWAAM